MADNRVEELVRNAVAQVLERQMASLRESVVQEVLQQIQPALGKGGQPGGSNAALQKAITTIQAGSSQKEILRALLESTILYSGRAAIFVIKNGVASGWQGTGFGNSDVKDFTLGMESKLVAESMQSRAAERGVIADFDPAFVRKFGKPSGDSVVVLPLLLKDKISALIYADQGDGSSLDAAALDVLVRATSSWLEVVSQRKQAHKESAEPHETAHSSPSNDPFAAHAPLHAPGAQGAPAAAAAMSAAAAWGGGAVSAPAGEDDDLHRKAQRFARLLMDEIKLYNQAKVAEGRKNRDLYDRLKEDIEKSRATYQKRYGNTAAASADYFNQELIRSLAEDDVSLMGSNFRR
ncbi:MAG TPA: hypothetical protein VL156_20915 [Terriglobales bacterium]|jgi:hypothetical protein|nr:hypothetical protein [Terriglobales bacterium]